MNPITEKTIAKFSWGILITMATGLVGGGAYITRLADTSEAHAREIIELKAKVKSFDQVQTDVAVIKSEVHQLLKESHGDDE